MGRFRIRRFLARGGMGEVYEAVDGELGEHVAVKVVRPEYAEDEQVMRRFRREVQLARRITHPSVCRIYDISRHREGDGELTLLSMELLKGETLAARLRREGPLDLSTTKALATQIIAGLAAAHGRGILHGDLKSSNVFLVSERGGPRAVLTDFGLARVLSQTEDRWRLESGRQRTAPLAGSLASLAPEVLEGDAPGPASDLYALGVVLFEMVTARLPFDGSCPTSRVACRLILDPPSPRRWSPGLDEAWEQTILRCLARRPEDRFAEVDSLAHALGLSDAPGDAPGPESSVADRIPSSRRPPRLARFLLATFVLAALGILSAITVRDQWSQVGGVESSIAPPDRRVIPHGVRSPDGATRTWLPAEGQTPSPGRSADAYLSGLERRMAGSLRPSAQLGILMLQEGELEVAREAFDRAAELRPGDLNVAKGRCWLALLEDEPSAALQATARLDSSAEPMAPRVDLLCRQLGLALLGRADQALAELADAGSTLPADTSALLALWRARWLFERGDHARGREWASVAESAGAGQWVGAYASYLQARAFLESGDVGEAESRRAQLQEEGREHEIPRLRRLAQMLAIERLVVEGRLDSARERLLELEVTIPLRLPLANEVPDAGWVLFWDLSSRRSELAGDLREAARYRRLIVDSGSARIQHPFLYVRSMAWLAQYRADRGELARARVWDRRFLELWGTGDLAAAGQLALSLARLTDAQPDQG